MHTKQIVLLLLIVTTFACIFAFALITPKADQPVIYYFKVLNANVLGLSTSTQTPTTPTPSLPTNSVLYHEPTLSATCIKKLLDSKSSQAAGNEQAFVDFSKQYNIDSAFVLGIFNAESTMGTAGVALHTHSIGNETCEQSIRDDSQKCYKVERTIGGVKKTYYYKISPTWKEGIEHIYKVLSSGSNFIKGGRTTIEEIAPWFVIGKAQKDLTSAESAEVNTWILNVKEIYDKYPQAC